MILVARQRTDHNSILGKQFKQQPLQMVTHSGTGFLALLIVTSNLLETYNVSCGTNAHRCITFLKTVASDSLTSVYNCCDREASLATRGSI